MFEQQLKKALELAEIRRGFTAPNPAVGAVVIRDGQELSTGTHWAAGSPHAEVEALNALGEEARGATLVVTLEPCCTWGRTPPCTQLIIDRGIQEVVYGFQDPNPEVGGKGAARLIEAGIHCQHVQLAEIDSFYSSYSYWQRTQLPWVTAKLAMTLDGKIAGKGGTFVAISGQEINDFTHFRRKHSDAILTTGKTVARDNPRFNARLGDQQIPKILYIIDRKLMLPPSSQIFQTAERLKIFHGPDVDAAQLQALKEKRVECFEVGANPHGLNLREVIEKIGADGKHDLWVEVGGTCFYTLAKERLIQQAYLYVSPKWLGQEAQAAFPDTDPLNLFAGAKDLHWKSFGPDALCEVRW